MNQRVYQFYKDDFMKAITTSYFSYKTKKSNNTILNVINGFYKIIKYILNNPGKALTLSLLGQVSVNNTSNHVSSMNLDYLDTLFSPQNFSSIPSGLRTIENIKISESKNVLTKDNKDFNYLESSSSFDHCQTDILKNQIVELKTWLKKQAILECVIAIEADNIKISKFKWDSILAMNQHNQWYEDDVKKIVK